jgi:hypothetical protein
VDQSQLVTDKVVAGEDLVRSLERAGMQVRAAFWLHFPQETVWRLLIASEGADRDLRAEHVRLSQVIAQNPRWSSLLTSSDVRIISPNDKLIGLMSRGLTAPIASGTRWLRNVVNGTLIEDALIYRLAA